MTSPFAGNSTGLSPQLQDRLAKVKMFLCDVDGILTDASVFISCDEEIKRFHIRDGLGFIMLRDEGFKTGWVSRRASTATTKRAEELKVDFLEQVRGSKVEAVENLLKKTNLTWAEVCYMGDDIVDLGVMKRAGFSATVADAVIEAKHASHYITVANGGCGAVREVIDLLLKAQNRWENQVAKNSA